MRAAFVELPSFQRHLAEYLDDDVYRALQEALLADPERGALMRDPGGLRKMRFADGRRGKGTRGGLRVLYFWWEAGSQFWMFLVYDKGRVADLDAAQRRVFRNHLKAELIARTNA